MKFHISQFFLKKKDHSCVEFFDKNSNTYNKTTQQF